jgi:hypothetical protein
MPIGAAVEAVDLRNMDRIRVFVSVRRGVVPARDDGVTGILRRKSVRMSLVATGSEMLPKSGLSLLRSCLRRQALIRQRARRVRRMPMAMPGKRPARMATTGNLSQVGDRGLIAIGVPVKDDAEDAEVREGFEDMVADMPAAVDVPLGFVEAVLEAAKAELLTV